MYTGFDYPGRRVTFHPAADLTDNEVDWLVRHIKALIFGHLRRGGYVDDQAALLDESEDARASAASQRRKPARKEKS